MSNLHDTSPVGVSFVQDKNKVRVWYNLAGTNSSLSLEGLSEMENVIQGILPKWSTIGAISGFCITRLSSDKVDKAIDIAKAIAEIITKHSDYNKIVPITERFRRKANNIIQKEEYYPSEEDAANDNKYILTFEFNSFIKPDDKSGLADDIVDMINDWIQDDILKEEILSCSIKLIRHGKE